MELWMDDAVVVITRPIPQFELSFELCYGGYMRQIWSGAFARHDFMDHGDDYYLTLYYRGTMGLCQREGEDDTACVPLT